MAQLALGIVGQAIGGALGGPIGARIGFAIGTFVGGQLFGPDGPPESVGPRLQDLKIQVSTYGATIPVGYGTVRVAGNVIWAKELEEVKTTTTSGGGKGGGGRKQKSTTYAYYGHFAVGFTHREATAILRMWADGKIIYDARSGQNIRKEGLDFVFHSGSEVQLPDASIVEDKGAADTPAYRGLCYAVFNRLPLKDFGNRLPNIVVEILFRSVLAGDLPDGTKTESVAIAGQVGTTMNDNGFYVDRKRHLVHTVMTGSGFDGLGTFQWDSTNLTQIKERNGGASYSANATSVGGLVTERSNLILVQPGGSNSRVVHIISGDSLLLAGDAGLASTDTDIDLRSITAMVFGAEATSGEGREFWVWVDIFGNLGIFSFRQDEGGVPFPVEFADNTGDFTDTQSVVPDNSGPHERDTVWLNVSDSSIANDPMNIWRVHVAGLWRATISSTPATGRNRLTNHFTIPASFWGTNGATGAIVGPLMNGSDKSMVFFKPKAGGGCVAFKIYQAPTGGTPDLVWATDCQQAAPPNSTTGQANNSFYRSDVSDGRIAWVDTANNVTVLNLGDGSLIRDKQSMAGWVGSSLTPRGRAQYYDGQTASIICTATSSDKLLRIFVGTSGGVAEGEPVSDIITDLALRAGYVSSDLDVSEFTSTTCRGFVVPRQTSARRAIDILSTAYLFDSVEVDNKITFVKLGAAPTVTVDEDDMLEGRGSRSFEERRTEEVELPETVTVTYLDFNRNYEEGTVSHKRVREPTPVGLTRTSKSLELAVVLTAVEAKQLAEEVLFETWVQRSESKFAVSPKHLQLVPTDVITITLNSGTSFPARINGNDLRVNLSSLLSTVGARGQVLSSVSSSDGGLGYTEGTIVSEGDTQIILLDIPLLRDRHNTEGTTAIEARAYAAMNGFLSGWAGGDLYVATSEVGEYVATDRLTSGTTIGRITNKLDRRFSAFQRDTTSQLDVFISVGGDLESVTEEAFLNTSTTNIALVGDIATGNWELINFKTAVAAAEAGRFTVSNILRGRRGTEGNLNTHISGETFILVTNETMMGFLVEAGQVGVENFYKGVSDLTTLPEVSGISYTHTGNDLRPYAPTHLTAVVDGSNNIDMSWVRQDRFGNAMIDSVDTTPMSELTETYDIDVNDKPLAMGGVSVKAFTVVDVTAVEMVNADVTSLLGLRATGILTLTGQPLTTETVILDGVTYAFQDTLTDVDGNVLIGTDAGDSLRNLLAAMDLSAVFFDKIAGTHYALSQTLHTTITGVVASGTVVNFSAAVGGTGGNSLATTETLTNGFFGGGTLSGGAASVPLEVDFVVHQKGNGIGRGFAAEARIIF